MASVDPRRRQLRDVADTQLGLVTAAQLAELGYRTDTASRRAAGGMWTRVLPGVHLVDGGSPSRLQREYAGFLYGGDGCLITGLTAMRHFGARSVGLQVKLDEESVGVEPVHLLISDATRRLSTGFARVERTRRLPAQVRLSRVPFPLAPVARAVGDAVRRMRNSADVDALVAEVVQRELTTVDELRSELELGQRRGSGLFRDAMRGVTAGARSGPEIDLVSLMERGQVPHVVYNARLVGPNGKFLAVADAWLDDVGVAVEVDSREHHAEGDGFDRTVRRNARYAAAGVLVVTVLPSDQRNHAAEVLRAIQATRHVALGRPRPNVRVVSHAGRTAHQRGWRYGA